MTVNFCNGTEDFTTTNSSVTFPTGSQETTFTPPIIYDDVMYEGETPEFFRIKSVDSNEYKTSYNNSVSNNSVDYLLYDNEPLISLISNRDTQEGAPFGGSEDGQFKVIFNRTAPQEFDLSLGLDVTVNKSATPGTFVATKKGSDYKIYYYFKGQSYQDK